MSVSEFSFEIMMQSRFATHVDVRLLLKLLFKWHNVPMRTWNYPTHSITLLLHPLGFFDAALLAAGLPYSSYHLRLIRVRSSFLLLKKVNGYLKLSIHVSSPKDHKGKQTISYVATDIFKRDSFYCKETPGCSLPFLQRSPSFSSVLFSIFSHKKR